MVLESLTNPFEAQRHVALLFVLGILYASVALLLSYWIFSDHAGLVMIIFVVLGVLPLFVRTMRFAEHNVLLSKGEVDALHAHTKVLTFLFVLFLGLTIAFAIWHVALPEPVSTKIFAIQEATILNLNQQVTGSVAQFNLFGRIFFNNVKVLIFSLFFSFLYGSGALFILTWNSSVIATAMGSFAHAYTQQVQSSVSPFLLYSAGIGLSLFRYFIHGIPEVLAYFVGALAGGILSVALMRGDLKNYFNKITTDIADLVIIAVVLLLIAGILEVFVTPAFFT